LKGIIIQAKIPVIIPAYAGTQRTNGISPVTGLSSCPYGAT